MTISIFGRTPAGRACSCYQLKLPADEEKMRLTDIVNSETLLRLVQNIPSQKAEPIKLWLAKTGGKIAKGARLKESASKTRSHG